MCKDPALTYLNELGYNVVRFPRADLSPLDVLGRQHGTLARLGSLGQLVRESGATMPHLIRDMPAVAIEARRSSRIEARAALSILRPYLSALGAAAGASAQFRSCRGMEFVFSDVHMDQASPADIAAVLGAHAIDGESPLWRPYLDDEGELFIVVETLKSQKLSIAIERETQSGASLDARAVQAAVGGQVAVAAAGEQASLLSFSGQVPLVFGFKCLQLRLRAGRLTLQNAAPGAGLAFATSAAMESPSDSEPAGHVLLGEGLLALPRAPLPALVRPRPPARPVPAAARDPLWAETAPVPEQDSPRSAAATDCDVLYLRLLSAQRTPLSRCIVRIRGPQPAGRSAAGGDASASVDTVCVSDDTGTLWLEGCEPGAYVVESAGQQALVHSLAPTDLETDDQPYTVLFGLGK